MPELVPEQGGQLRLALELQKDAARCRVASQQGLVGVPVGQTEAQDTCGAGRRQVCKASHERGRVFHGHRVRRASAVISGTRLAVDRDVDRLVVYRYRKRRRGFNLHSPLHVQT